MKFYVYKTSQGSYVNDILEFDHIEDCIEALNLRWDDEDSDPIYVIGTPRGYMPDVDYFVEIYDDYRE